MKNCTLYATEMQKIILHKFINLQEEAILILIKGTVSQRSDQKTSCHQVCLCLLHLLCKFTVTNAACRQTESTKQGKPRGIGSVYLT